MRFEMKGAPFKLQLLPRDMEGRESQYTTSVIEGSEAEILIDLRAPVLITPDGSKTLGQKIDHSRFIVTQEKPWRQFVGAELHRLADFI